MLILSQDKKAIHNFNNIISIQIEEGYNGFRLIVYGAITNYTSLGKYKTEERAKEVLQEILKLYKVTEIFKIISDRISGETGATVIQNGFIYEMPEK